MSTSTSLLPLSKENRLSVAFIDYISYDDASEDLRELYRKFGGNDEKGGP